MFHFLIKTPIFINNNLSFKIEAGQKIAIVGENGVGKSTLVKLLLRLYDVDYGDILFNGHSIKDYDVYSLRKNIGVSFQSSKMYALPFIKNLSLYRQIREEDLKDLIERSDLEFILKKNNASINTDLTREFEKDGIILSSGESQKVAVARIIGASYDDGFGLLIFDEPSSALDPNAECDLSQKLLSEANKVTTIIISHRLSMVTEVDKILVFAKGQIVEAGNHCELMKKKGKYYEMFSRQAKNYIVS